MDSIECNIMTFSNIHGHNSDIFTISDYKNDYYSDDDYSKISKKTNLKFPQFSRGCDSMTP